MEQYKTNADLEAHRITPHFAAAGTLISFQIRLYESTNAKSVTASVISQPIT